jgi:hypothetical protein
LGQTNLLRSRYLRIDREKPKIRFSDIFIFNLVGYRGHVLFVWLVADDWCWFILREKY